MQGVKKFRLVQSLQVTSNDLDSVSNEEPLPIPEKIFQEDERFLAEFFSTTVYPLAPHNVPAFS